MGLWYRLNIAEHLLLRKNSRFGDTCTVFLSKNYYVTLILSVYVT